MITVFIIIILFIISFVLALRALMMEFSVPAEVNKIKISPKKKISGVILFLKKKIIHYSAPSS